MHISGYLQRFCCHATHAVLYVFLQIAYRMLTEDRVGKALMSNRRVTKRAVDALHCPAGRDRVFLWDDALSGFGVAAFPSGKKVYVVQFRQDGRSRRMTIAEHGRKTPDEARSMAKKLLGIVEDGIDPIEQRRAARGVQTFREVSEEFLKVHIDAKRKGRTSSEYRRLLDNHLLPALGSRPLNSIKRLDLARLHGQLSEIPPTANRCLAVVSSLWNWAAARDEVSKDKNPARGIERYPEEGVERYLSADELARLGDALRLAETTGIPWDVNEKMPTSKHIPKLGRVTRLDPYAVAAIRLLILTGARLRELLHAKWDYVDWDRGLLLLPDSKTGKKTIYLSAASLAVLKGLKRVNGNPYIVPGSTPRKSPKRSTSEEGTHRVDLKKPWAAVVLAACLENVRLHDLRHSFAATGAGASLGLPMIGKLLGHSQPATTARYAHLDADPMKRAANVIGDQITAAMERRSGEVVSIKSLTTQVK
jgi:integrase